MSDRAYPLLLLVPGLVALILAQYAWRRRQVPTAGALAAVMASVAVWSLAFAGELSSGSLQAALIWIKIEYVGIAALPVTWLVFALYYAGHSDWLIRCRIALLCVIPVLTVVLVMTNDWHHLHYVTATLANLGHVSSVVPVPGPAYWLHTVYSYLLILTGLICIIRTVLRAAPRHREQGLVVIAGVLAPWITNACYLLGLSPVAGIDFTPFAFTMTGLLLLWALFRLRLLDLAPVARDAVFEAISDGVVVVDECGRIADLNAAAERILGCTATDSYGAPMEQLLPCWPQVRAYCDDAGVHRLKQRLGDGDDARTYEMRLFRLKGQQPQPTSQLLLLSDVTEEERAHEALRAIEVSYHELFNAVAEAIYIQDREGRFLDINYGAELMYGYPRDFFIGRTPEAVAAPGKNDLAAIGRMIERAFAGEPQEFEFWGQRANGEIFPKVVHLYKGTYLGQDVVIALAQDITARKQVENTQRLAATGQLAAGVAHEFNNLLAAMLLQAEMADPDDPHSSRDLKELVLRSARRGGATCADLMAFAKPTEPRREPVLITETVERALAVARRQLENAQVAVERDFQAPEARVHGDPHQLEQVMLNLVINAVDAMSGPFVPLDRRRLTIGVALAERAPNEVVVSIRDTGTGIAPEHLSRVFEPFFTTKTSEPGSDTQGTGLGLSVSHGIVAAHGGRMEVASETHRGTTFVLHLPLLTAGIAEADEATSEAAPPPPMRPARILLAEDEPDVLDAVVTALRQLGHTVTPADSTETALAALREGTYDVVVTDLMMPGAGGAAIVRQAQTHNPPPPTVVITGRLDPQLRQEMTDLGAGAVLQKPFSLTKLLDTLAALLAPEA